MLFSDFQQYKNAFIISNLSLWTNYSNLKDFVTGHSYGQFFIGQPGVS